ncbi:MAG: MarR family transcriptional regulator [Candidatus Marinimicrobia bacterium]|nr:MarR family transcriptional regulator [Candidatus Neomarinimicrobiota bacterium]
MPKDEKLKSEIGLGMLIGQVHRLSTKRFVQKSHKFGLDISLDQWLVLGPIWKNEGIAQKDIAEYCGKDKTSITKIINTLEKKNLVVRVADQIDHRVKRIVLSNKGKELFLNALPVMEETRDELRSGISDKEIESLITVLTKVYRNLISN